MRAWTLGGRVAIGLRGAAGEQGSKDSGRDGAQMRRPSFRFIALSADAVSDGCTLAYGRVRVQGLGTTTPHRSLS